MFHYFMEIHFFMAELDEDFFIACLMSKCADSASFTVAAACRGVP